MNKLNQNIKKFREFRKITQKELADMLGKSKNVISNWECGANNPDLEIIEKMCGIFDVTPNMMFGWDECPEYEDYIAHNEEMNRELQDLKSKKRELQEQISALEKKIKHDNAK